METPESYGQEVVIPEWLAQAIDRHCPMLPVALAWSYEYKIPPLLVALIPRTAIN